MYASGYKVTQGYCDGPIFETGDVRFNKEEYQINGELNIEMFLRVEFAYMVGLMIKNIESEFKDILYSKAFNRVAEELIKDASCHSQHIGHVGGVLIEPIIVDERSFENVDEIKVIKKKPLRVKENVDFGMFSKRNRRRSYAYA